MAEAVHSFLISQYFDTSNALANDLAKQTVSDVEEGAPRKARAGQHPNDSWQAQRGANNHEPLPPVYSEHAVGGFSRSGSRRNSTPVAEFLPASESNPIMRRASWVEEPVVPQESATGAFGLPRTPLRVLSLGPGLQPFPSTHPHPHPHQPHSTQGQGGRSSDDGDGGGVRQSSGRSLRLNRSGRGGGGAAGGWAPAMSLRRRAIIAAVDGAPPPPRSEMPADMGGSTLGGGGGGGALQIVDGGLQRQLPIFASRPSSSRFLNSVGSLRGGRETPGGGADAAALGNANGGGGGGDTTDAEPTNVWLLGTSTFRTRSSRALSLLRPSLSLGSNAAVSSGAVPAVAHIAARATAGSGGAGDDIAGEPHQGIDPLMSSAGLDPGSLMRDAANAATGLTGSLGRPIPVETTTTTTTTVTAAAAAAATANNGGVGGPSTVTVVTATPGILHTLPGQANVEEEVEDFLAALESNQGEFVMRSRGGAMSRAVSKELNWWIMASTESLEAARVRPSGAGVRRRRRKPQHQQGCGDDDKAASALPSTAEESGWEKSQVVPLTAKDAAATAAAALATAGSVRQRLPWYAVVVNVWSTADKYLPLLMPSTARSSWDLFLLVLLLYTAAVVPLQAGFRGMRQRALTVLDNVVLGVFWMDIAVQFRTAYISDAGELVRNTRHIAAHYTRTWLPLDLVSSVPWAEVLQAALAQQDLRVSHLVTLLRVIRLLKLVRLLRQLDHFRYSNFIRLGRLFGMMLMVAHWTACVWHGMAEWFADWPWTFDAVRHGGESGFLAEYSFALYSSFVLVVGSDNLNAHNNMERAFYIFMLIIGAVMYALIVSNMAVLAINVNSLSSRYRTKATMAADALRYVGAPQRIRDRVAQYYEFLAQHEHPGPDADALLYELPRGLMDDIKWSLYCNPFHHLSLFAGCDEPFMAVLQTRLTLVAFTPGEVIFREGEAGQHMYLVRQGVVLLRSWTGDLSRVVRAGEAFSELALLPDLAARRNVCTAIAVKATDLVALAGRDLAAACRDHPQSGALVQERLMQQLEDRLHGTQWTWFIEKVLMQYQLYGDVDDRDNRHRRSSWRSDGSSSRVVSFSVQEQELQRDPSRGSQNTEVRSAADASLPAQGGPTSPKVINSSTATTTVVAAEISTAAALSQDAAASIAGCQPPLDPASPPSIEPRTSQATATTATVMAEAAAHCGVKTTEGTTGLMVLANGKDSGLGDVDKKVNVGSDGGGAGGAVETLSYPTAASPARLEEACSDGEGRAAVQHLSNVTQTPCPDPWPGPGTRANAIAVTTAATTAPCGSAGALQPEFQPIKLVLPSSTVSSPAPAKVIPATTSPASIDDRAVLADAPFDPDTAVQTVIAAAALANITSADDTTTRQNPPDVAPTFANETKATLDGTTTTVDTQQSSAASGPNWLRPPAGQNSRELLRLDTADKATSVDKAANSALLTSALAPAAVRHRSSGGGGEDERGETRGRALPSTVGNGSRRLRQTSGDGSLSGSRRFLRNASDMLHSLLDRLWGESAMARNGSMRAHTSSARPSCQDGGPPSRMSGRGQAPFEQATEVVLRTAAARARAAAGEVEGAGGSGVLHGLGEDDGDGSRRGSRCGGGEVAVATVAGRGGANNSGRGNDPLRDNSGDVATRLSGNGAGIGIPTGAATDMCDNAAGGFDGLRSMPSMPRRSISQRSTAFSLSTTNSDPPPGRAPAGAAVGLGPSDHATESGTFPAAAAGRSPRRLLSQRRPGKPSDITIHHRFSDDVYGTINQPCSVVDETRHGAHPRILHRNRSRLAQYGGDITTMSHRQLIAWLHSDLTTTPANTDVAPSQVPHTYPESPPKGSRAAAPPPHDSDWRSKLHSALVLIANALSVDCNPTDQSTAPTASSPNPLPVANSGLNISNEGPKPAKDQQEAASTCSAAEALLVQSNTRQLLLAVVDAVVRREGRSVPAVQELLKSQCREVLASAEARLGELLGGVAGSVEAIEDTVTVLDESVISASRRLALLERDLLEAHSEGVLTGGLLDRLSREGTFRGGIDGDGSSDEDGWEGKPLPLLQGTGSISNLDSATMGPAGVGTGAGTIITPAHSKRSNSGVREEDLGITSTNSNACMSPAAHQVAVSLSRRTSRGMGQSASRGTSKRLTGQNGLEGLETDRLLEAQRSSDLRRRGSSGVGAKSRSAGASLGGGSGGCGSGISRVTSQGEHVNSVIGRSASSSAGVGTSTSGYTGGVNNENRSGNNGGGNAEIGTPFAVGCPSAGAFSRRRSLDAPGFGQLTREWQSAGVHPRPSTPGMTAAVAGGASTLESAASAGLEGSADGALAATAIGAGIGGCGGGGTLHGMATREGRRSRASLDMPPGEVVGASVIGDSSVGGGGGTTPSGTSGAGQHAGGEGGATAPNRQVQGLGARSRRASLAMVQAGLLPPEAAAASGLASSPSTPQAGCMSPGPCGTARSRRPSLLAVLDDNVVEGNGGGGTLASVLGGVIGRSSTMTGLAPCERPGARRTLTYPKHQSQHASSPQQQSMRPRLGSSEATGSPHSLAALVLGRVASAVAGAVSLSSPLRASRGPSAPPARHDSTGDISRVASRSGSKHANQPPSRRASMVGESRPGSRRASATVLAEGLGGDAGGAGPLSPCAERGGGQEVVGGGTDASIRRGGDISSHGSRGGARGWPPGEWADVSMRRGEGSRRGGREMADEMTDTSIRRKEGSRRVRAVTGAGAAAGQ